MDISAYNHIWSSGAGFIEMPRGLISVCGKEAIQFLDGLISNDMKTLEDGGQMLAAFPNAQGRLLAVVRVFRQDDQYFFETEEATREKVFNNLFKFTFAGDFFVQDISDNYRFFQLFGDKKPQSSVSADGFLFASTTSFNHFVPLSKADSFRSDLVSTGVIQITDDLYETLRIENGTPLYGVDMDETTIVPELGLDGLISYNKGCYIGQEIIARIHFRGHIAKQLAGLILSENAAVTDFQPGAELKSSDGKNAGRVTSVTFSPKLDKIIALGYVRYDYLAKGTELKVNDITATVVSLPF